MIVISVTLLSLRWRRRAEMSIYHEATKPALPGSWVALGMTRDEIVEEQLVETTLHVPDRTAAAVWLVKWQYSER